MFYKVQKSVTRNGTLKSTTNPWNMDRIVKDSPEHLVIIGNVVSIEVAPPAEIGASFPNHFTIRGAPSSVMISHIMLANRAIVPISVPLYWVTNMLDSE